jgi:hypothetical protein
VRSPEPTWPAGATQTEAVSVPLKGRRSRPQRRSAVGSRVAADTESPSSSSCRRSMLRLSSRHRRREADTRADGVGNHERAMGVGKLRTNYGPQRPKSAHLNRQPWTPAISGSRSTTVGARSGGQGVASSNLASPTVFGLVGAGLPGCVALSEAVERASFQDHFKTLRFRTRRALLQDCWQRTSLPSRRASSR